MRSRTEFLALALIILVMRFILLIIGEQDVWFKREEFLFKVFTPAVIESMAVIVNLIAIIGFFITKGAAFTIVAPLFIIGLLLGFIKESIYYIGHNLELTIIISGFLFVFDIWFISLLINLRQVMALFLLPRLAYNAVEMIGLLQELQNQREREGERVSP